MEQEGSERLRGRGQRTSGAEAESSRETASYQRGTDRIREERTTSDRADPIGNGPAGLRERRTQLDGPSGRSRPEKRGESPLDGCRVGMRRCNRWAGAMSQSEIRPYEQREDGQ